MQETETKYVRSMRLLGCIKSGERMADDRGINRLLEVLIKRGFISRRPGRRLWATDSYDLTLNAEKLLEEYERMRGV